nr:bifunctional diguanylate cyclase/phosphodiesterase [Rhizobium setariae]
MMAVVPLLSGLVFLRFGHTLADLRTRLRARERAERYLLSLSMHDRLTGLPNRLALEKEIAHFLQARAGGHFRPALMLLDLDRFKHVNDTLGHDAGDELLRQFTDRLRQALGPLVRLFRLGGDEFVATLAGAPDESDVEMLCGVIEAKASEPFALKAGQAVTGISIGITYLDGNDASMADILKRADLALYMAKDVPGSSHVYHTESMGAFMQEQMQLEQEIAIGLANEQFFLEYQPIVRTTDCTVESLEALIRWRHPTRGVMAPEAFLPLAERAGHMTALGRWVMTKAIADASAWPSHIGIAVNVCAEEFRAPGFVAHIRDRLLMEGLDPSRLTIEITEAIFADDLVAVRSGLEDLRAIGVRVMLDDFGIGLSSINHLRQFPIDGLKVDRSYTEAMLDGGRETDLIDIIVKLGRAFNMPATVEGVENERQMHMALSLGAAAVQGYLISRPVPAGVVQQLLMAANGAGEKPEIRASA